MTSHLHGGQGTKRPDYGLGRTGGHVLPHVGKGALTNPKLAARRDQGMPTVDPPRGGNRVLDPSKPPRF
jgi:hypothetical protein